MSDITGPRVKLNRAAQQFESLDRELLALSDLKSYTVSKDVDSKTGNQIYSFADVPLIPDDLSLRIGEMLYNFRCSLDHLIWHLVVTEGNIPSIRNEFPIFNDSTKYESDKVRKLNGIPNTVVPIIDALQPCHSTGPNDYWWYLWYLHELSNADKHRHLLITRRSLGKKLRMSFTADVIPKANYLDTPVEDGATFAIVEPNVDVDIRPTIQILFDNAPSDIRKDLPVGNILNLINMSVLEVFKRLDSYI